MVSVIIPCYNQGAYIQETIDSVLAQTYTSWEIIIVNDGSTDIETIIKLEELERDNYKVIHIENSGVSVARNVGIANANGEFILPLDADDKIAPTYIAEAIQILENNSALKLVYADCGFFGELQGISPVPSFTLKGILFENLIYNAAIFRKTDFNKTNGYDSAFRTGWEDWDFWLDFIKNEKEVYKINKVLFYYRIKKESRNSLIVNEKRALCEQQLYKKDRKSVV